MEQSRSTWKNRFTFIFASVGSAVGLGNAWRFPGLAAKYGGGAFLLAYLILMLIFGIPLLMMEIAMGRKVKRGVPQALGAINKKLEPIGWAATTNAFFIVSYYAVVFAWVILMAVLSFKFAGMVGDTEAASNLWANSIKTTWAFEGFGNIAWIVVICLVIAWAAMYLCIRNGAATVGKVVKYTVTLPILCLIILAIKGFTMKGAGAGLAQLFIPDFSKWADVNLWVDAAGQVFYSLSIMMAIMVAYGSFLDDKANIATDAVIIALSDFAISTLSAIVLFTTMYGVGKTYEDMSASGIATAFIIYPTAIVNLTTSGVFNAIFAFIFYFCLITLAIDSAFSIVEGISTAVADKFKLNHKKTTFGICIAAAIISFTMASGAGVAILDTLDHFCNYYTLVIVGILECVAIGWCFKTSKVLEEINKNTTKFKMPFVWFNVAVKFVAPILLSGLFVWTAIDLFRNGNGLYGGYPLKWNIIFGWVAVVIAFASGFIIRLIINNMKKKGFVEEEIHWDDIPSKQDTLDVQENN